MGGTSSPGAAGAPRGGPGARPGVQSCCHSFLDFSRAVFRQGSPRLRGGRANWQPKPWADFLGSGRPAAGEGKLSPGPEPCSVLCRVQCARLQRRLRRPLGTVASFLALGGEAGRGRWGGGGLYWTRFPAKQLRLSCSQSPRPESSHLFSGGRWGAARPCSRGSRSRFFHHQEDALREGTAGSPRRFSASDWPGNPLHTHSSRQRNWGLQRCLARPTPSTRLL